MTDLTAGVLLAALVSGFFSTFITLLVVDEVVETKLSSDARLAALVISAIPVLGQIVLVSYVLIFIYILMHSIYKLGVPLRRGIVELFNLVFPNKLDLPVAVMVTKRDP